MITVINRGDWKMHSLNPKNIRTYSFVLGFSARYIDLPRDVQLEILSRTTY
jgi:hypothetical protein